MGTKKQRICPIRATLPVFAYRQKQEADGRSIPAPSCPFPRPPWRTALPVFLLRYYRSSLRGIAPYRWCVSYRLLLFAMSDNFKHVCLGKRVRAVWQLRRSRAIFTARRKLASNTWQGHLGEVASVLVLSVFSAGELVRDVVTAVGDCSFRRRFLWGRKSNEFAQPNMNR